MSHRTHSKTSKSPSEDPIISPKKGSDDAPAGAEDCTESPSNLKHGGCDGGDVCPTSSSMLLPDVALTGLMEDAVDGAIRGFTAAGISSVAATLIGLAGLGDSTPSGGDTSSSQNKGGVNEAPSSFNDVDDQEDGEEESVFYSAFMRHKNTIIEGVFSGMAAAFDGGKRLSGNSDVTQDGGGGKDGGDSGGQWWGRRMDAAESGVVKGLAATAASVAVAVVGKMFGKD